MSREIIDIFREASTWAPALPILIGLLKLRSINKIQSLLFFLVIAALTTDVLAQQLRESRILENNIAIYNVYTLVAFNLIWTLYRHEISILNGRFTLALQVAINFFGIINGFFIQGWNDFNSNLMIVSAISYLTLATISFRQILLQIKYSRLEKTPIFWINTGILIYYSGTLILFALSNRISNVDSSANNLHLVVWALNCIFNILLNIAYSLALWQRPKK